MENETKQKFDCLLYLAQFEFHWFFQSKEDFHLPIRLLFMLFNVIIGS